MKRLARRPGIDKPISPHSLRYSFITPALDAGVALGDVQEAASHADPRTTMVYNVARGTLDRHVTYIVATFVAGAELPGPFLSVSGTSGSLASVLCGTYD